MKLNYKGRVGVRTFVIFLRENLTWQRQLFKRQGSWWQAVEQRLPIVSKGAFSILIYLIIIRIFVNFSVFLNLPYIMTIIRYQ